LVLQVRGLSARTLSGPNLVGSESCKVLVL
jgi:hypothetical protein